MPRKRIQGSGSGLGQAYAAVLAAQRGPLPNKRSGGSRRSSTSQRARGAGLSDPNLQRVIEEISKKQGGGNFLDGIQNAAKSGFKGALDVLDTPRAAILSIGKELGDLGEDGEFSFKDLVKQTRDNYSFGEFLNEEVAQTQDWSPAARFAASMAGDIAADPLTFLAPGANIERLGAKGAAEGLLRSATDDALKAGITNTDDVLRHVAQSEKGIAGARTASTRSLGGLNDEMRRAAGAVDDAGNVERGVYWNAPGTGRIGRRLKVDKAVDALTGGRYGLSKGERLAAKQIRLGGGKALSATHETLMRPVAWGANKLTRTAKFANGADAGFREMFRSGDPELATKGFHGLEASQAGRLQDRRFAQEFSEVADQLIHDARKAHIDMEDLHYAAQGDGPTIEALTKAGHGDIVERARAFYDDAAITANQRVVERGGQEIINLREDYAPRILTDDAREAMGVKQGPFPKKGKRASIEKARKYVAGEDLFGVRLLEPAEHPEHLSVERQMEEILADHGVDKGWFSNDASKVMPAYARLLGRRVGQETTAGMLIERGMGEFAYGYTAKGQRVVDARAQAFKMSEAARRRGRIARGELGDATERLAVGEAEAGAKAKAGRMASQDARRAAQEASAAAQSGVHPGAEAIREYAQHWDDLANDAADGLSRFMASTASDVERTSAERALAHAEALAHRGQRDRLAQKVHALTESRDAAWERATRLWDEADARLNAGKTLGKIEAQIADAESQIRQVNDLIDELGVAADPRPEAAIVQDLQDVLSTQRQLGGRLRAAQKAGDADAVARIQRDIETARAWSAALKHEKATGKMVSDEGADMLVAGKSELARLRADIQQHKAEAEALGNDQLAMTLAAMDERLPVWDASTQTLVPGPGVEWNGAWYHGTPEGGSMAGRFDPSGAGHIDNANGMHMTTSWSAANRYADKLEQGITGDVAAFDLAIQPNEMLTYSTPYDIMEMMNPNDSQFDRLWKFGSPWGHTKAQILDDNLKYAIREGIVDVDDVMEAIASSYSFAAVHTREAIEEGWDDLYMAMDEVMDEVANGSSLMESLAVRFDGTDLDPYVGQEVPFHLGEDFQPHWTRAGNRIMHQIQEGMSDGLKREVGMAWQERMRESGMKGVFYDHGYGGQELILFDQGAARLTPDSPRPFRMADEVRDEMRSLVTRNAEAAQRTAQSYDGPIVDARLDYEGAAARAMESDKALHRAESALADQRSTISAKVRSSLEEEVGFRTKAKEARRQADEIQQTYIEEQQMKAAMLGEQYDARLVDEDRIAVHNGRQVATLEADFQQAQAEVAKWDGVHARWDGSLKALESKHAEQAIDTALDRGLRMFGASTLLPEDMTEVLTAVTRLREPGWSKKVLGTFDYVQNLWKGYATASPGFLSRNLLGGVFNNALAGIDRSAYQHFLTAAAGKNKGIWQEGYEAAVEAGILTGGQSVAEVAFRRGHVGALKRLNPFKPEFAPIATVRAGSHKVEEFLRGSLFMDVYAKTGGNVDQAISAVNKFHFDYDDLSSIERSVFRRVIPFYTWTRKNFPLQLEMLARNPKVYNRFTQAKHNLEAMSSDEDTVPGYFGDNFSVRLPWTREGGNVYYMPDLPFTNMMEMTNPGQALANTSPFIKTPIELWAGKQMWQDIPFNDKHVPVSPAMEAVPGLMPALQAAGWATHNAAGDWVMKDRHMYAVTSFMPTLAQARRLMPAEERYQQRALTSWLSFMGAGLRTNTSSEQANQKWGRYYDLKDRLALLEDLGFVGQSSRMAAEAKYGPRDPTDQQAPVDATARLLEDYEATEMAKYEDEELNSFAPYQPK